MKFIKKIVTLAMLLSLTIASTTTAFAAEPNTAGNASESSESIPVVFESSKSSKPIFRKKNDSITFSLGSTGYISDCGLKPKFKCWVTGGSASTQVKFNFVTSGGVAYNNFGPVNADGSNYLYKSFIVFKGNGTWQFTATVTSGSNPGNLVCHVQQYY